MLGIAFHSIQHSQAMLERGVCELAHSFFHFFIPPANDCPLSNNFDVIFYCSVGERSGALTLLNAASDLTGILQTDDQGFSLPELKATGAFL